MGLIIAPHSPGEGQMSEVFGTKPDKDTTQLSSLSLYCLCVPGTVPRAGKLLRNISVPGTPVCQPRCSFWPSAPTLPPLTPFHRTGQQQSYRVASTPLAERVLATEACCNLALSLPASPAYTLSQHAQPCPIQTHMGFQVSLQWSCLAFVGP